MSEPVMTTFNAEQFDKAASDIADDVANPDTPIGGFDFKLEIAMLRQAAAQARVLETLKVKAAALPKQYQLGYPRIPGAGFAVDAPMVALAWLEGVVALLADLQEPTPSAESKE